MAVRHLCIAWLMACASACALDATPLPIELRPALWAQPQTVAGLPNLHRVTPWLWRGAQPTADGMKALETMGIKTVITLRAFHDDDERLEGTSLAHHQIFFKSWHPEDEDVVAFLKIVAEPANRPIFVHCQHGADRTGMMCAITRITLDGWSKDAAVDEMVRGGFGFHPIWTDLVDYVNALDVDRLRTAAGLPAPAAPAMPTPVSTP